MREGKHLHSFILFPFTSVKKKRKGINIIIAHLFFKRRRVFTREEWGCKGVWGAGFQRGIRHKLDASRSSGCPQLAAEV